MSSSQKTKIILAFNSGGICAFGGCGLRLTEEGEKNDVKVVVGEAAHIEGEKPGSARFNASSNDVERNSYKNLIYLCPTHHTLIDKKEMVNKYSVLVLQALKKQHEKKVAETVGEAFSEIGFQELEFITEWLIKIKPSEVTDDYSHTPPEKKMAVNGISQERRMLITMGLSAAGEVSNFIDARISLDSEFGERLKAGFLSEYYKNKTEGLKGDELFDAMCYFATRGMTELNRKAAGMAVLMYLFDTCEVFEK